MSMPRANPPLAWPVPTALLYHSAAAAHSTCICLGAAKQCTRRPTPYSRQNMALDNRCKTSTSGLRHSWCFFSSPVWPPSVLLQHLTVGPSPQLLVCSLHLCCCNIVMTLLIFDNLGLQ